LPEGLQLQPEVISSFRRKLWYNIRQGILSFNTIFFFLICIPPAEGGCRTISFRGGGDTNSEKKKKGSKTEKGEDESCRENEKYSVKG
jgi:hypothetical protein